MLSRHWECFDGQNRRFITFKNENFWFEKKILFEIPDQKTVLQATLKSEFSKNFFRTLISIQNTLKKISLTKSIDKSGHPLGDPFKIFICTPKLSFLRDNHKLITRVNFWIFTNSPYVWISIIFWRWPFRIEISIMAIFVTNFQMHT